MKGKIAIIGNDDSVLAFKAGGVDSFSASHPEFARDLLKKLAKEYQIIFITDTIAKEIDDLIARYLNMPYPIILTVPSKEGSNGYGMKGIKKSMEKALGVDILFGNDNDDKQEN